MILTNLKNIYSTFLCNEDLLEEVVTEENVEDLRQQVEASVNLSDKDKSVLKFLNQCNEAQNIEYSQEILSNDQTDQLEALSLPSVRPDNDNSDGAEEEEEGDVMTNLREYNNKFKPFRDPTETGSVCRSVTSSTGSTIHPDIVKQRVRQSLEKREKRNQPRRTVSPAILSVWFSS